MHARTETQMFAGYDCIQYSCTSGPLRYRSLLRTVELQGLDKGADRFEVLFTLSKIGVTRLMLVCLMPLQWLTDEVSQILRFLPS